MSRQREFAQAGTSFIPILQNYIQQLRQLRQTEQMIAQIVHLSEQLFQLQNAQIISEDARLTQAIAALREANRKIQEEITEAKEFNERVQTAAAIAGLIQRAIGLAVA